jgi:hypothetical protein
LEILSDPALVV